MSKILLCINKTKKRRKRGKEEEEEEGEGEDSSSQDRKVVKTKAELSPSFSPQERLQI